MSRRKCYRITKEQFTPVIQFIYENYPAGVTGRDIDLSAGLYPDERGNMQEPDTYKAIKGVTLGDYSLIFSVITSQGNTLQKEIDYDSESLSTKVEEELMKYGYKPSQITSWQLVDAEISNHNLNLTLDDVDPAKLVNVEIPLAYVVDLLPDMDEEESQYLYGQQDNF